MSAENMKKLMELDEKYKNREMDVFEYLSLIPDEYLPNREELMKILKEKNNGNTNSDL